MDAFIARLRQTPASELVLWGSLLFTVVLLVATGGFLFRNPVAPADAGPALPVATQEPPAGNVSSQPATRLTLTTTPTAKGEQTAAQGESPVVAALPTVTAPTGGQVIEITPGPADVGWVREEDTTPNHFGDYNIYAGSFDGLEHIGVVQFDLSAVPPGAQITYADLTLSGLTDEWLRGEGIWHVELLESWMANNWSNKSYAELQRTDGALIRAGTAWQAADLSPGESNTLILGPAARSALEASVFTGRGTFRVRGPRTAEDNLFSWDSGYGTGSRGRAPVLRLAVGPAPQTPPISPTPNYVIITSVPQPQNIMTLAARNLTATAETTPYIGPGTPTPSATATQLPPNWVTPFVVVPTGTPANMATAEWRTAMRTAEAIVQGTPTPFPPNAWTATPAPTATATVGPTQVPLLIPVEQLTPEATRVPATPTPLALPAVLSGKIGYLSDRFGPERPAVFVYDPATGRTALLTDRWAYERALELEPLSPDGKYVAYVETRPETYAEGSGPVSDPQIWIRQLSDGWSWYLTGRLGGADYEPAWSPDGVHIAYVAQQDQNDEIYVVDKDTQAKQRLTVNDWEWDKHPSWSPDGSQIVFWSNRGGLRQIWIMNADGTEQRLLFASESNNWDPVWFR